MKVPAQDRTNAKYNRIRDIIESQRGKDVQLMPGADRTTLPSIEELRGGPAEDAGSSSERSE